MHQNSHATFVATYPKKLDPLADEVIEWLVNSGYFVTFDIGKRFVIVQGNETAVDAFIRFTNQELKTRHISIGALN